MMRMATLKIRPIDNPKINTIGVCDYELEVETEARG